MANRLSNSVLRAVFSTGATRHSDRELLAQFCEGDEAAFERLVKRHTGMVLGVCRRALPNVQDAEDACQATFLVLARKAKMGGWQPSIANWLYKTARRVAATAKRTAERRVKRESVRMPAAAASALDDMTGREVLAALDEELENLPEIYREPLVLCYLEGLTRDEAATRLGIPSATVKSQLDRGRKKLADALTKRGISAGLLAVVAISSAEASPQLFKSILTAVGGSPSATVSAIAKGALMNGFTLKAKLSTLAALIVCATGIGWASMGAPVPAPNEPNQPAAQDTPGAQAAAGVAPKFFEIRPNAEGKITVPVLRTQNQKAPPAPPGGVRPHYIIAKRVVENVELADVKNLKITTVSGKDVSTEDAVKALATGGVVVVSGDGNTVSPKYLKIVKSDALVFAAAEIAAALDAPSPPPRAPVGPAPAPAPESAPAPAVPGPK